MTIRTRPATQEYRDNYDAIFGDNAPGIDDELGTADDIHQSTELSKAYEDADYEVASTGLIGLDTAARIMELGGSLSKYD